MDGQCYGIQPGEQAMKQNMLAMGVIVIAIFAANAGWARADDPFDEGGRVHFEIGLGGVTGMDHVDRANRSEFDTLSADNANKAAGGDGGPLSLRSDELPVGPMFNSYYLFHSGIGLGGGIGPITFGDRRIRDSAATTGSFDRNDEYGYLIAPVGLDARYEFINKSGVIPYVRGGFRYPLAFGYNTRGHWDRTGEETSGRITDRTFGLFGAVGIEFPEIHLGMEAAYDSSKISMGSSFRNSGGSTFTTHTEAVEPDQFMFAVFFRF